MGDIEYGSLGGWSLCRHLRAGLVTREARGYNPIFEVIIKAGLGIVQGRLRNDGAGRHEVWN